MSRSLTFRRFLANTAGVAAIEFAFIAPVLITMYFGVAELTQAMMAARRVSHTGATIGDLVTQGQTINVAAMNDVFTVGQTFMAPYPTTGLQMRITHITTDASNNAKVDWSQGSGMGALAKNSPIVLPAGVITASQSVVKSEVSYTYTSAINYVIHTPITFTNTYYLRPRLSNTVVCTDCP